MNAVEIEDEIDTLLGRVSPDALLQRLSTPEKVVFTHSLQTYLKRKAEQSFFQFFKQAWEYIWPSVPFEECTFYEPLCNEIQTVIMRNLNNEDALYNLMINIPPGTAKTTLFSICIHPWVWIHNPTKRFITTSYSPKKAFDNCKASIDLINCEWYQENWGHLFSLEQEHGSDVINNKGGRRIISAPEVKVGTGYHADFIINDDPQNVEEVYSSTYRESVTRWRDETLSTRLANKRTGVIIDVQQRLHVQDYTNHIRETQASLTRFIVLPAENLYGNVEPKDWEGLYVNGLLSPSALLSPLVLDKAKVQLRNAYQGQYNQHPVSSNGSLIKMEWVKWFTPDQLPQMELVIVSADTAQTDVSTSCPVSIQTWAKELGKPNFYLLGDETAVMSILSSEIRIAANASINPGCSIVVERAASGYAIIENLRKKFALVFPFDPKRYGGKEKRAEAASRYWEAGNVFILNNEYYKTRWLPEIIDFPNGAFKDRVDAMSQALIWMNRREFTQTNPNPNPRTY